MLVLGPLMSSWVNPPPWNVLSVSLNVEGLSGKAVSWYAMQSLLSHWEQGKTWMWSVDAIRFIVFSPFLPISPFSASDWASDHVYTLQTAKVQPFFFLSFLWFFPGTFFSSFSEHVRLGKWAGQCFILSVAVHRAGRINRAGFLMASWGADRLMPHHCGNA